MAPMIKAIFMAVCSLALLQLVACRENFWQNIGDKKVELESWDDWIHTNAYMCPVEEAFEALQKALEVGYVCTMDKATRLTRFYDKYLRARPDESAVDAETARQMKTVGQFAIVYGLQVSNVCRETLMRDFYPKADATLKPSDYEAVEEWTRDDSPIARLLGSIAEQGEFLMPVDFASYAPEVMDEFKLKLTTNNDKLSRVQEVCEKRFRPLYESLVLPIAHLSRYGINYMQDSLYTLFPEDYRKQFQLWSRVVFLCESMKEVELVATPAGSAPESTSLQRIKPYEQYIMINGRPIVIQSDFNGSRYYRFYSPTDIKMNSALKSFNATLRETDRFREELIGSKWNLLFATLKSDENTRQLFEGALEMVMAARRESNNQEELKLAEKEIIGLLDSKNDSTFPEVLSELASKGMALVRSVTSVLISALLFALVAFRHGVLSTIDA